jgi:hypothetical protein
MASSRFRRSVLLCGVAAFGLALAVALTSTPAAARFKTQPRHKAKAAEHVSKDPFGNIPRGQLQIFISINQEKLHLYSDGTQVAEVPVATGLPGHPTPMGVFSIIEKDRYHHSNIYSGAPMPYMQRITWSGVAMHEGVGLGHPASHGCIRLPREFAARLWVLTKMGERVIIARNELKPVPFADPHLFIHKEPATAAAADPVKTAQTVDDSKKTDAVDMPAMSPAASQPAKADPAPTAEPAKSEVTKEAVAPAAIAMPDELVPVPLPKPARLAEMAAAAHGPIAVFVSRKEKKIFVRQHFAPLFTAPITIAHPEQPIGTHVFTAMAYLDENNSGFRWNVVTLAGEPQRVARNTDSERPSSRHAGGRSRNERVESPIIETSAPTSPNEALARLDIPQDVVDQISALIVPGSSLIVSDQGLGPETGTDTDFIVITR